MHFEQIIIASTKHNNLKVLNYHISVKTLIKKKILPPYFSLGTSCTH